jgi:hypothetical protein
VTDTLKPLKGQAIINYKFIIQMTISRNLTIALLFAGSALAKKQLLSQMKNSLQHDECGYTDLGPNEFGENCWTNQLLVYCNNTTPDGGSYGYAESLVVHFKGGWEYNSTGEYFAVETDFNY